jgi:hypothetical protein
VRAVTAAAYVATVESTEWFSKAKEVDVYLGLMPRRLSLERPKRTNLEIWRFGATAYKAAVRVGCNSATIASCESWLETCSNACGRFHRLSVRPLRRAQVAMIAASDYREDRLVDVTKFCRHGCVDYLLVESTWILEPRPDAERPLRRKWS